MTSQSRRDFLKKSALVATAFTIIPRHVLGGKGYIAPSDIINLGVIGTGKQAVGLARRFAELPGALVVAGADVYNIKLKNFKSQIDGFYAEAKENDKYSDCKIFEDYQELLALEEIDAVLVVTPDHWHAIQAIDSMKAGKDVYCEKPLSHNISEGRKMVDAARKYNKVVQTGSMQRSNRNFRHACELVYNGYIGEVSKVLVNVGDPAMICDLPEVAIPENLNWDRWVGPAQMRPYHPELAPPIEDKSWANWRAYKEFGGGILSDWGAHMFDIAQWGLGMDNSGPVKFMPPEDPAAKRGLKMVYANGVEMMHEDFERGWGVRFIGSEGSLDISRNYIDSKPEIIASTEIKSGDKRLYFSDNHYQDWLDAIKARSMPICDVETGHRSSSVCNLANIAYQLNQELNWDPEREKFSKNAKANDLRAKKYRKPYLLE